VPKGGLARRASAIKTLSQNTPSTVLVLDAGNALSGQYVARLSEGEVIVEAMSAMGYDAMGVGTFDTMIGLDALKRRVAQADFGILSANLAWADTGELLLDPYIILERDGLKFGILGLSPQNAALVGPGLLDTAVVTDPTEAAARYVAELRPQVDAVIVLSLLGVPADRVLAETVPGINVIVGGNSGQLMLEPIRVGDTLIVQQGYNGEWMGMLQVTYDAQGVPSDYTEAMITLGPEYPDDPDVAAIKAKWDAVYPQPTLAN